MLNAAKTKDDNKYAKFRLGLNGKLLIGIAIPVIIILFILTVIVITKLVGVVSSVKRDNIENQIQAASIQIQGYFEKFFVSEDF